MYTPKEDSFLLSETIFEFLSENYKKSILQKKSFLDLGCGSCIQAETASKLLLKKNILCVDIDENAIKQAKKKGFQYLKSDLFLKINQDKQFDFIAFNVPYLPEHKLDNKKDTSGGKKGDETTIKFLEQVKDYLKKQGIIFLLISSFTPLKKIKQEIKKQNLKIIQTKEKELFFEKLYVFIIKNKS
jgi:release factor glutamine methyltransferase